MQGFPNLRAEMARSGVSKERLAECAGCTVRTVDNWFAGNSDIPVHSCFAIRDELFSDMPLDYLFSDDPQQPAT